jgi:hypothetical protein
VLAFLGYSKPFFAFGEDILTKEKTHPWAICYNHPIYQLFSDRLLMQFDGKRVCAVYDYQDDPLLKKNIVGEVDIREEEKYLRAYVQQYIYRLTTNQLKVES